MEIIGPAGVVHEGTYSGNPTSLAAVDATLDILRGDHTYDRLEDYGNRLMRGLQEVAGDLGFEILLSGVPEMFQLLFTSQQELVDYRDLVKCDLNKYAALHVELLNHGVMMDEDNMECLFTCSSHTSQDLEHTLAAFAQALEDIRAGVLHTGKAGQRHFL